MLKDKNYSKILIAIFMIAVIIRIYNDPTIPFHYDPGKNIVYVRAVLDQFPLFPQYNPYFNLGEYYEYQILFPYIVALLNKITGFSLIFLTSWSIIIIGSLMVITVFLLSKEIYNYKAGLITAGLIAIDKIQLFSYMNYYPQILALTLLPLPFICLIRYTRTNNKKYLIYTSILSSAIILSSYLAGIVYLSILILSLILYSITRKELKWINALISILVGSLLLITFYILPIIERYGIKSFISGILSIILTKKDFPFTNASVDTIVTIMFQFIFIIIFFIFISLAIYLINKNPKIKIKEIKYEHILLFVWILISLILVESYRFRPLLWTDRYLEFLDMAIIIIAGYSIYFIIEKVRTKTNNKIVPILILIIVFSYPTIDVIQHKYAFGYWNMPNDLDALSYVHDNISPDALFVTSSGVTSFWVSALGGVHVLGGESSQILGEKFDGNSYSDDIINNPNITEKIDLIRKFGVQYIYITIRAKIPLLWRNDLNNEGLKAFDNPNYFEFIYEKTDHYSGVFIIKVKENLVPKYNQPKINTNITILGYMISFISLIIMMIILKDILKDNRSKNGF